MSTKHGTFDSRISGDTCRVGLGDGAFERRHRGLPNKEGTSQFRPARPEIERPKVRSGEGGIPPSPDQVGYKSASKDSKTREGKVEKKFWEHYVTPQRYPDNFWFGAEENEFV